jgi:hypothetical protein
MYVHVPIVFLRCSYNDRQVAALRVCLGELCSHGDGHE